MTELSGLTEAIEAALLAVSTADTPIGEVARAANAVRAAAPILVRAALRQAADRIVANADGHPDRVGMDIAAAELRLTADSLHEGTTP